MIGCSQAIRQLWEYLDGTTEDAKRAVIDEHLQRCRRCCGELEFARELRSMLSDAVHEALPDDVLMRLNRTIEELDP